MTHYVPGAVGSKWQNPFQVNKYGQDKCIDMYKEYIQTDTKKYDGKTLLESLDELRGKTLGCWCKPDPCHGDVIVQLLKSKVYSHFFADTFKEYRYLKFLNRLYDITWVGTVYA